jgi:hypothetical protein
MKFLAFFPDGRHVMQVFLDGAIQLRVSDGQRVGSYMAMPDVNACAISRDGRWFVAGHDDQVTVWDVTTQNKVCEHNRSHDLWVSSRSCSGFFFWMLSQLNVCTVYRRTQAPYFTALAPDSSRAAIGDSTGSVILLSIPLGETLVVCRCYRGPYLDFLQFSPAGDAVGMAGKITDGHVTTPSTLQICFRR